jgi:diguanylate cyclase (GGDEF)-like protein
LFYSLFRALDGVGSPDEPRKQTKTVEKPAKSLLIVDDDPLLVASLTRLLQGAFQVFAANSQEWAQTALESQPIDLILTARANHEWLVSRLLDRNRELERLSRTDALTGLFNRLAMEEMALMEVKRQNRYGGSLSLGFVDVDYFKQINSDYLLTGGDAVLKGLAGVLARSIRAVDSVGRIGGDEFMILARETGLQGAAALAERVCSTVGGAPIEYEGKSISLTVSIGFAATEPGHELDYEALTRTAAATLAEAKARGRNCSVVRKFACGNAINEK